MKLLVYSAKEYEVPFLKRANTLGHKVTYIPDALDTNTALKAMGFEAISIFSGDDACLVVLEKLRDLGVKYITLRSAGYNNIQIKAAKRFGLRVANAPDYSPNAIAEHATALLMTLNRKIHIAQGQVHAGNFKHEKLLGFDLKGKTVGIVGTGRIGSVMTKIMHGFGCRLVAYDIQPNLELVDKYGLLYLNFKDLCSQSDVISIHVPLTQETHYLFDENIFKLMKPKVLLVNTARGAIVNTKELIKALKNGNIAGYATDVYEKEKGIFFIDNSLTGIKDEKLKELLSFENVVLTPHQAYVTHEALANIAEITFKNIECWEKEDVCTNELGYETLVL